MAKVDYGHYWRAYARKYEWHKKQAEKAGLKVRDRPMGDWRKFSIQIQALHDARGWSYDTAAAKLAQKAVYGNTMGKIRALAAAAEKLTGKRMSVQQAAKSLSGFTMDFIDPNDLSKKSSDVLAENIRERLGIDPDELQIDDIPELVWSGRISLADANAMLMVKFGKSDVYDRAEWISQNIYGSD